MSIINLPPAAKAGGLRNGDVRPFVCPSVRWLICLSPETQNSQTVKPQIQTLKRGGRAAAIADRDYDIMSLWCPMCFLPMKYSLPVKCTPAAGAYSWRP